MPPSLQERKARWYDNLVNSAPGWVEVDARWAETNDPRFYEARTLDDWLVAAKDNNDIAETDFRKRVQELHTLYHKGKQEHGEHNRATA